jgi:TorA maturation chaperone TorD
VSNFPILDRAAERAAVYELLARLWDDAPDAELMQQLADIPSDSVPPALNELLTSCGQNTSEELAVEYTRLFVGPKEHLPPFQSVWEERQLDGEAAVSMRKFGDVIGIENAMDHLGVQLGAMGTVLSQTATTDGSQHEDLASLAASFFVAHLTWPTDLLSAIERRSACLFYQLLATVTRDFLASEQDM